MSQSYVYVGRSYIVAIVDKRVLRLALSETRVVAVVVAHTSESDRGRHPNEPHRARLTVSVLGDVQIYSIAVYGGIGFGGIFDRCGFRAAVEKENDVRVLLYCARITRSEERRVGKECRL